MGDAVDINELSHEESETEENSNCSSDSDWNSDITTDHEDHTQSRSVNPIDLGLQDNDKNSEHSSCADIAQEESLVKNILDLVKQIYRWSIAYRIGYNATTALLKILCAFFLLILPKSTTEKPIFPKNVIKLQNAVGFDKDLQFNKFIVCPNPECTKLFEFRQIYQNEHINKGKTSAEILLRSKFCYLCNEAILKEKRSPVGIIKYTPLKLYCCRSIILAVESLLSRNDLKDKWTQWETRELPDVGYLGDIYDGQVWKEFVSASSKNRIGLILNCDWFRPYKRRNQSIGVLYCSIMNLPRNIRQKPENVILLGLLPALAKEPTSLNTFLKPIIDELKHFQKGIDLCIGGKTVKTQVYILCTTSDIPATRKLCGFLGHSARLGCSKCLKEFSRQSSIGKTDYSGFQRSAWPLRSNQQHRQAVSSIPSNISKTAKQKFERRIGCRYSALLDLSYFDPVRYHVIDLMHNIFEGTAKRMFQYWLENNIIQQCHLKNLEKRVENVKIVGGMGRVPVGITTNHGNLTAAEWKNWTVIYSLYCLQGLLPEIHLACWHCFVLACRILVQPLLSTADVVKADGLLLEFCKKAENIYGKAFITPNMHLHGHLKQCIRDYGPPQAYWLFSFERYNGILGSYTNVNKNLEEQLMVKFLSISHSAALCYTTNQVGTASELDFTMYSNMDMDIEKTRIVTSVFLSAATKPVNSINWRQCHQEIELPPKLTEKSQNMVCLDYEDMHILERNYLAILPNELSILKDTGKHYLPSLCFKFKSIKIASQVFGSFSQYPDRSFILASWANEDGTINVTSYNLRAGQIQHFLKHSFRLKDMSTKVEKIFAVVSWFKEVSTIETEFPFKRPLINIRKINTIPPGPATFMPVERIFCNIATAKNFIRPASHSEVGIPLGQKHCI